MLFVLFLAILEPSVADRVEARLKKTGMKLEITRADPETLDVKAVDGHHIALSVKGATRTCREQPSACDAAIEDLVTTFIGLTQDWLNTTPRGSIRAVIKDPTFFWAAKKSPGGEAGILRRPFAGNLSIVYVEEGEGATRVLKRDDLNRLKLTEDELHALALRNLDAAFKNLPARVSLPGFNVYVVNASDCPARLLVPRLWQSAAKTVKGPLVAVAVSRNMILFTGSANPRAVAAMMANARDVVEGQEEPLALTLLEWTGEGWQAAKK